MSLAIWKLSVQNERLIDAFLMRSMYFSQHLVRFECFCRNGKCPPETREESQYLEGSFISVFSESLVSFQSDFIANSHDSSEAQTQGSSEWEQDPACSCCPRTKPRVLRTLLPGAQGRWTALEGWVLPSTALPCALGSEAAPKPWVL